MSLSWKDAVATLTTGTAAAFAYAKLRGWEWAPLNNWRVNILLVFALGIGACIASGTNAVPVSNTWTTIASALGIIAMILLVAGLILGDKIIFFMMVADVMALWAISTAHHLITNPA